MSTTEHDGPGGTGPSGLPFDPSGGGSWLTDLGLELDEVTGTRVTAHLDLGTRHHTPFGVIHGGVYATVVESVGSIGASVAVADRQEFAVGLHNSTDFLRPARGGRVDIVAVALMQGRTQQLWEITITRDEDGKPVASGRLRLQNVPLAAADR